MAFIRSILVENYKRFERFTVSCRQTNIFVGPNNAGKSTVLDALRIFSAVHRYASRARPIYREHDGFGGCATYELAHTLIGIPIENVVRNYGDDFARISISIDNGSTIHIRLHPDHVILAFVETDRRVPRTSADYRRLVPINLVIVPTLSALESEEEYVSDETVFRNETTRLASRNFRNIVMRKNDEEFARFSNLVSAGWPNIELQRPEIVRHGRAYVSMLYSEDRFLREVYWSGFGFQVWMQMTFQFLRGDDRSILVLDEPDIYLHPDLQKKMLRIAKERFGQIFIATHSSEILNEADSGDILLVNSGHRSAQRVISDDAFRRLYSYIGSSENAEFARLARADRIVFFEGGDKKLLRKLAAKARLDDIFQDSKTVYLQTGGFSQWTRVKEVDWALHNIFHLDVRIAAIFDRDYRCVEEVDTFKASLANENLWVDVLGRKEIENYLIVTRPLAAAIQQRLLARGHDLDLAEIRRRVLQLTDGFRDVCRTQQIAHYISHHGDVDRHTALPTHISRANQRFEENWDNEETRFAMLPGKDFISVLSATFQRDFGASITANQILEEMTQDEVPADIILRLNNMAAFLRR
ncbi:ATP-dependent nuclease [Mesorhizobium sophorae]|uniref:ATP-dependent nuclease n=1 Tax=Mesorhizobium sophorae TaxID=1300294 RepID=UPI000BA440ED|nr:ATP-binding protein [Mesorhizobium sophorae]